VLIALLAVRAGAAVADRRADRRTGRELGSA
jgi:hypothetical protein